MIALIGGSSQVALEVAMYLKRNGIKCVSIVRSEYSSIILRLMELDYVVCASGDPLFEQTLSRCSVVADFTFPSGLTAHVLSNSKVHIEKTVSVLKPGTKYIYMSSIWAHGMGPGETIAKDYLFPQGQYSYIKRSVEKFVRQISTRYKVQPYNLRLGQVHGFLQSVLNDFIVQGFVEKVILPVPEDAKSNVVFTSNIADALSQIADNKVNRGTYTLILSPQWTLKQLYGFYEKALGVKYLLQFTPLKPKSTLKARFRGLIIRYRPFLETYILMRLPGLADKVKKQYRLQSVGGAFAKNNLLDLHKSPDHLTGTLSKANLFSLETDQKVLLDRWIEMKSKYNDVLESSFK